ncbi:putative lipoprotein [Fimbriiglobus ruber]|uniref:Putative lipoprotein n=2 Tax=Fimbriiglobus ruber TaxID=1908690 RepID=A0A225DSX5_9BACT|nr:putative lipoprotein [Fimbriiglobus ruber]
MVAFVAAQTVPAADPPKDTTQAAFTRNKKLKGKVTVDFKNEFLKEALKEISGQLEDQKLGQLSTHYAPGVSQNTRITYAGKDVTAEEALDGIFKQLDLGYVVTSKDKDRYDGWLEIAKGNERGFPAGTTVAQADPKKPGAKKPEEMKKPDEPKKTEEAKKPDPKKPDEAKKPDDPKKTEEAKKPDETKKTDDPDVTEEDEKLAKSQLDLAKKLQDDGKADRAKTVFKFVVKKYPGTKAAAEAKEILEKGDK